MIIGDGMINFEDLKKERHAWNLEPLKGPPTMFSMEGVKDGSCMQFWAQNPFESYHPDPFWLTSRTRLISNDSNACQTGCTIASRVETLEITKLHDSNPQKGKGLG